MSEERERLRVYLCGYAAETLRYMQEVSRFCERSSSWLHEREKDVHKMMDIKDRADNIDLKFYHVMKAKCSNKCKALWEYIKNKCCSQSSRRAELQHELAEVLNDTQGGLGELHRFLDAVENLAVTSLHVFTEENQVLHLPEGIRPERVQVSITAARTVCPLLLEFRRDARVFFLPKLQNVEVLSYQLDRYIQTTQNICDKLQKSCVGVFLNTETLVDLSVDLSDDDIQRMLNHINQLNKIRNNQSFRTVFLFQEEQCRCFISEFSQSKPGMLQCLTDLEQTAVQLDRMSKGAKISSVVGSLVGAVGGVLSIIGWAIVSRNLTIAGVVLSGLSALTSFITTFANAIVNYEQHNNAIETFRSLMKGVQVVQNFLVRVIYQPVTKIQESEIVLDKVVKIERPVLRFFDFLIDAVSTEELPSEKMLASAGTVAVQEGKVFSKTNLVAAVKAAKAKLKPVFFILLNLFFVLTDVYIIYKDSISLAKGIDTELSQFIRARAALWSLEMDSWQKIHDFLTQGPETESVQANRDLLETPFLERDI